METVTIACGNCAHELTFTMPSPDDDIAAAEGVVVLCDYCDVTTRVLPVEATHA